MRYMIGFVMLGLFTFIVAISAVADKNQDFSPLDLSKPDSWKALIDQETSDLGRIAKSLISVVQDKDQANETRRTAIFLLGTIGTKESLNFLVSHISLDIPGDIIPGRNDMAKVLPCRYALVANLRADKDINWNIVHLILNRLEVASDSDFSPLVSVLDASEEKKFIIAMLEHKISSSQDASRKKNLDRVKQSLQQE